MEDDDLVEGEVMDEMVKGDNGAGKDGQEVADDMSSMKSMMKDEGGESKGG